MYRGLLSIVMLTILIGLLTVQIASSENGTLPSSALPSNLRIVVCPSPSDLDNIVTASSDGRVLVFWENESPTRCFDMFLKNTRGHSRNATIEMKNQYYRSLVASSIKQILAIAHTNTGLKADIEKYGFNVFKVAAFKDNILEIVIETSKPGGLGTEFAKVAAEAAAKVFGINQGTVFIMYTAPNTLYMLEQLVHQMNNTINWLVKEKVTIAIGSIGYMPVVIIDTKAVSLVGGIQNLANIVANSLPEGGWALLILREKPPRFNPQPSQLSESTEAVTQATTPGEQVAGVDTNAPNEVSTSKSPPSKDSKTVSGAMTTSSANTPNVEKTHGQLGEESTDYIWGGNIQTSLIIALLPIVVVTAALAAVLSRKR